MAYELKTKVSDQNVVDFLQKVENPTRRQDGLDVLQIMQKITGEQGKMWGASIIGFGSFSYVSKSGIHGDWFKIGFSPRKQSMTLYLMCGFEGYDKTGKTKEFLARLGKHKISKSCLYINKLADVDLDILKDLITFAWQSEAYFEN